MFDGGWQTDFYANTSVAKVLKKKGDKVVDQNWNAWMSTRQPWEISPSQYELGRNDERSKFRGELCTGITSSNKKEIKTENERRKRQ